MEELIGKFLNAAIPWILPVIILCSFLANHGYNSYGKGKDKKDSGESKSTKSADKKAEEPPVQDDSMK